MCVIMGPEMSLSLPDLPPGVKVAKYKVHVCDWACWEATMGYIYKIFVRTGDVLHGSLVQFGIIMYLNRLHSLRVSV